MAFDRAELQCLTQSAALCWPPRLRDAYMSNFFVAHAPIDVGFVTEHQEASPRQSLRGMSVLCSVLASAQSLGTPLFKKQRAQLVLAIVDALAICCVDHPDQGIRLLEVVLPVGTQSFLPSNIP